MRSRGELEADMMDWIEALINDDGPYTSEYIRGRIDSIRWVLND